MFISRSVPLWSGRVGSCWQVWYANFLFWGFYRCYHSYQLSFPGLLCSPKAFRLLAIRIKVLDFLVVLSLHFRYQSIAQCDMAYYSYNPSVYKIDLAHLWYIFLIFLPEKSINYNYNFVYFVHRWVKSKNEQNWKTQIY